MIFYNKVTVVLQANTV